jgi:hypothetical protein
MQQRGIVGSGGNTGQQHESKRESESLRFHGVVVLSLNQPGNQARVSFYDIECGTAERRKSGEKLHLYRLRLVTRCLP